MLSVFCTTLAAVIKLPLDNLFVRRECVRSTKNSGESIIALGAFIRASIRKSKKIRLCPTFGAFEIQFINTLIFSSWIREACGNASRFHRK